LIPTIGIMVACYIITRMTAIAVRQGDRAEPGLVRALAGVTILVALWGIVSLLRGPDHPAPGASLSASDQSTGSNEAMTSNDHIMRAHQLLTQMPPANGANNEEVRKIMAEIEFHNREAERLKALGR